MHLVLAAFACLALSSGLSACQGSDTTTEPSSAPRPTTTTSQADPSDAGSTQASATPGAPLTQDGSTGNSGAPLATPSLAQTWETAVQAMADDDATTFLTVANQDVYDELTTELHGADISWKDWEVMGRHGAEHLMPAVTAGACTEGLEQAFAIPDIKGDPTVTCHLDFTGYTDGTPDQTMGLFYLQENSDGSWTIVDYLRQYN